MTYEPWKKDEYLIRFEHIMDKNDDPALSLPQTFNISEIFPGDFQFTEMNLAANQRIEDVNRLHFRQEGGGSQRSSSIKVKALSDAELTVTLDPMQIKTFIMQPVAATTTTRSETEPTAAPTAAPTVAPTPAPTSAPSGVGVISQNVFKFIPLIIMTMIWRNTL